MNILPKKYSQFKEKQYWDSFFSQLRSQNKSFQWYGTLKQYKNNFFFMLNNIYNRNNKQKSMAIAHLGCGNSTLAEEIISTYQIFDFSIVNLDYSEAVIEEMRIKAKEKCLGQKISYEVCDLLKPIPQQFIGKFDLVIDKGTLDAILPQDNKSNIAQIEQIYFKNVRSMLKKGSHGSYIIISMLQQFVLKTILESFRKDPHFTLNISQCTIQNSQLQPFFVEIPYTPIPQASSITVNLLNKTVFKIQQIVQVQEKVKQLQKLAAFTGSIKGLRAGQVAKFNIYLPETNRIKYMLDIVDSNQESTLLKNNCAVFIVPPGMQTQFAAESSIKQIQQQIGTSRTIIAKLVVGQNCKSVQEVKEDLNPILDNLIQKGCNVAQVPYLTDGSFSERQYLYRDQEIFIQEILQEGECFRRLILKEAPSLIQSQFKLTYHPQKNANKSTLSIALPPKKGLIVGLDQNYLDYGYCRTIVAGLSRLVELEQSRGLHLGGGGCTIAKFLVHKYSQIKQKIIESSKSVIINGSKYFDWPQNSKSFEVLNLQAYKFINQLSQDQKFDFIIVDINNREQFQQNYPPIHYLEKQFVQKCVNSLNEGGVIVYNTIQLDQRQKVLNCEQLFFQATGITQVYQSKTSKENIVYFAVKNQLLNQNRQGQNMIVIKNKFKSKIKGIFDWQQAQADKIVLVKPETQSVFKQSGLKVIVQADEQKKKKKKKK